jgi:hypothetical protein
VREPEQVGVEQRHLAGAVPGHEPPRERTQRDRAERDEREHELATLLPHENTEHDTTHADDRERGADAVDLARSRVLDVAHHLDARQHHHDHDHLEREPDRHERKVVTKPPSSGPTAAAIAAEAPTSAYAFLRAAPSKFPWMSDCIAGSSSDAPSPPMIAQRITIAVRLWASVIATAPTA